jgi:hypothetical protein
MVKIDATTNTSTKTTDEHMQDARFFFTSFLAFFPFSVLEEEEDVAAILTSRQRRGENGN